MLKIGITGGIGSGKTTVCKIFETLDIPIYYADDRAKWLMNNDLALKKQLIQHFGEKTYTASGVLDRAFIATVVFNNPTQLAALNRFVHPAVARDAAAWHEAQKNVAYTLKEAALIYEIAAEKQYDAIIAVTAPLNLRIERTMQRDHLDEPAVRARIANQMDEAEKVSRADFVIFNDGKQALVPQVMQIHQAILQLD
jgi:dephospho-CoA kinase